MTTTTTEAHMLNLATLRALFSAKHPLRDPSFYAALLTSLGLLLPELVSEWHTRRVNAGALAAGVAPITAWLGVHGYARGKGAESLGAVLAAIAPSAERLLTVFPELGASAPVAAGAPQSSPAATNPPNGSTAPSLPVEPAASEHVEDYSTPIEPFPGAASAERAHAALNNLAASMTTAPSVVPSSLAATNLTPGGES